MRRLSSRVRPTGVPSHDHGHSYGHGHRPAAAAAPAGAAAGVVAAAPAAPPATHAQVQQLVDLLQGSRRCLVLTGAGVSTESGIPDYRSPQGAYSSGFKPMTHQQFLAAPANRSRYWARSFYGWPRFSSMRPNAAHAALAELQQRGWVEHVITQNVDRLHQRAGLPHGRVTELHGTTHEVVCLGCGAVSPRGAVQEQLAALNPAAAAHLAQVEAGGGQLPAAERQQQLRVGSSGDNFRVATRVRPDGDVELGDAGSGFAVPPCSACGGVLKPHVVFFGDNIPQQRKDRAAELAASCDLMLVVGSSVMVYSAFRLVEAARQGGAAVAILNVGPTRADKLAAVKVEALAGEVLPRVARSPSLLLPRL